MPIAQWARAHIDRHPDWEIDFVDLLELALPFMDEPSHPRLRQYTHQHTRDWSARVETADAFLFVTPEYNHSSPPALRNAMDFLSQEWWRKPVGFVSYGGVSGGTRSVANLAPALAVLGMVRTGANVEIPFATTQIIDGSFVPTDKERSILDNMLDELGEMAALLRPAQNR